MRHARIFALFGLPLALLLGSAARAGTPVLWDESDLLDPPGGRNISANTQADDFAVVRTQRLTGVDLFLMDGDTLDDGIFTNFSGAIAWGIYDNGGIGGGPGSLLANGTDLSPAIAETGLHVGSNDIFRVHATFEPAVTLASGSYWLAFHEGAWGAADDGTQIYWERSAAVRGLPVHSTGAVPSSWAPIAGQDVAFVLYGSEVIQAQEPSCCLDVDLSLGVWANAFSLPMPMRPSGFAAWLVDGELNHDGQLGNFSGTLGWAIYAGEAAPTGDPIVTGQDASPREIATDFDVGCCDVVRVAVDTSSAPELAAGSYWLAIHEGAWGAPYDESPIRWLGASGYDAGTTLGSWEVGDPTGWWTQNQTWDSAFVLFPEGVDPGTEPIFASGFDAGVTCAWGSPVDGATCP